MRIPRALVAAATVVGALALTLGGTAVPASAAQPGFICEPLDSGKIDTTGDPATVTVEAPEGQLIDGYCVKAGTSKYFVPVSPPQASVEIDHPTKGSVSHYSVSYTTPTDEEGVPIPAAPGSVDECGTADDAVLLPETPDVTWSTTDIVGGEATATATAVEGKTFVDGTTTQHYTLTFTDESCDGSLTGSLATGECVANAPWIVYDIALDDPNGVVTATTVSLLLSDGVNSETLVLGDLVDGALSGKILWPGASVAADGVTPTGWPGWAQVDGQWVETDDNFAWTRSLTTATLTVNPELEVALSYPPATPDCAAAPPSGGSGAALAETGSDAGMIGLFAAALLVIGGGAMLSMRRRNRAV